MCSECGFFHCVSACPNYEPIIIGTCPYCKEDITENDEVYALETDKYHKECIEDNAMNILVNYLVAKVNEGSKGSKCPLCEEIVEKDDETVLYNEKTYHLDCFMDNSFEFLVEHGYADEYYYDKYEEDDNDIFDPCDF